MPTHVLIFGAGAIGAFYGSRLAENADTFVSVICRSNYQTVKANGFAVSSPQYGSYRWIPYLTFPSSEAAKQSDIHWSFIVVSTKALPDVSDDSSLIEEVIGRSTTIVLIQNGLGVEKPYFDRFPHTTILSCVTILSAAQPEHGKIEHNRWTRTNIGPYTPNGYSEDATTKNKTFVDLLLGGGIKDATAESHERLQLVRWHKIAINAAMNPSSVLSGGSDNASMSLDSELYTHLKGVMDEVLVTAPKVIGESFPPEFASSAAILRSTQKNSSGSKPSMQLDWEQGKKMELEVILGNPLKLAREKGLNMPRMQSLYALLRMAQKNRENPRKESKL